MDNSSLATWPTLWTVSWTTYAINMAFRCKASPGAIVQAALANLKVRGPPRSHSASCPSALPAAPCSVQNNLITAAPLSLPHLEPYDLDE